MTNGAASKKTSSITVGAVLERIRSDYWKIPVERVQFKFAKAFDKATKEGAPDPVGKAKSAVDAAKRDLPGVCWSGSFSERAIANLLEHSGYICADCDNLGDRIDSIRQQLRNDPHVQAFFTSPTGTGLKVLIRIEASKESHERSYLTVEKHFRDV